ncbi:MAG: phospho-sugar mutase [Deltaproteobacteria bacterium]|nr:phospho-sugar mutase [Deltaproteobacteria bacterium]
MSLSLLVDIARAWMAADPDPVTRAETEGLIASGDEHQLAEQFGARLEFGTAGIRGALAAGPNRMNRLLVRKVSAGLAQYLLDQHPGRKFSVVIGFDGRHLSREFAEDTAAIFASRGVGVWLYEEVAATPQLAHAVVALGCAAGVMVTASHNPPQDNGYKVYWENGAQIIEPHDKGISAAIDLEPALGELLPLEALLASGAVIRPPQVVCDTYRAGVRDLRVHPTAPVKAVYTAMHGVGRALIERVMGDAGYADIHLVPEQADPDPDFPTVSFPNPEEPGALDLGMALADKVGADVLIANDPDADRLAVAVPDGAGGWARLSGDQVGQLLADDLLRSDKRFLKQPRMVATTVVSSSMLRALAEHYGVEYRETLTGFKWIANAAIAFEGRFVMGYEEALGYSVGPLVRDKDGVSAAVLLLDLVAHLKEQGRTLLDRLEELYRTHGLYMTSQVSLKRPGAAGAAEIQAMMDQLRAAPPDAVAGTPIWRLRDLAVGTWKTRDGASGALDIPASNVLGWDLEGGGRVVIRPSGTEPKIKFYFEARLPFGEGDTLASVRERGERRLRQMAASVVPTHA